MRRLSSFIFLCFVIPLQAAPLSGTRTIGFTGDYFSITEAIADVQAQTLGGPLILELDSSYNTGVETFPLTFPSLNGASAVNTLTLRPQAGAGNLTITSGNNLATMELSGARFLVIDGRAGGTGTAKQLTIANTSTSGTALFFVDEASGNTLRHVTLQGRSTSATSGVVVFGATGGANGNDNNTLETCSISGDGLITPANCIYSLGATFTPASNNSGNTISNCNVFNFYASSVDAAGVRLDGGNTDWSITGNSFYQTATRTSVPQIVAPIHISNTSGNNFIVSGNSIGGSEPNCGGTAWTTTGTSTANPFRGIQLNVGTTTVSSVQGNTIANILWTSTTALYGVWSGIYVLGGNVNIGTVTGNTIGSGTGTGSISITTSGIGGGTSYGIGSDGSATVNIANNTIGSITTNGSASNISASLTGIQVTAGANTISNNTVGSTTTVNSINAATSSDSAFAQQVTGILSSSSTSASITGNTVANLNNNYVSTDSAGQIRGIVTTAGVNTITGNTVRNLSTTSANANIFSMQSLFGIASISLTAGQTLSRNTVHSLANTATSADVNVTGIYFATGTTSTGNVIARNFVHSLALSSSSATAVLNGMQFTGGAFTAQNNVVRVGLKADGTSTAGASQLCGIFDQSTTEGRNFYHNSVYLGGTASSGSVKTFAFSSAGGSNAHAFQNNIFVNARSNGGGTGKHYAVDYGGSTVNYSGLTAGGNIFLASGTGGVLGRYNSADRTTLASWQAATGQDLNSAVADPLFVAPTGDASTVDLHLQTSNPAERGGIALTAAATGATVTVTDDFDGQTRGTLTPADVGADAGNFTLTPGDIFAPGIRYPLLSSGTTANRVLTGWATITDNTGSVSGGANTPRLYFKKSADADVFGGNTAADNGWKYVTGTDAGGGSYSFTFDYSLINGGSVSIGDTVQYFVVAQDAANNLVSSPAAVTASANPPVQNVSGHGAVNSFSILGSISGTKTVGTGGDYPSLSGAGGLFAALNGKVLTGNVVVNITSDLTETGGVSLNEFLSNNDFPLGNAHTLTLQPDSATTRTISGTATAGLITLSGADRVTIDGRFGGSGRYLTFRNTSTATTASTLRFINDASNNTVRNCVVEGASTSSTLGVIGFSTGAVTGNEDNLITGCQVRDLSTAAGVPRNLFGSTGSSVAVANSGNTVSNNELFNFTNDGININAVGNDSWTFSGNNIYQVNAATGSVYGMVLKGGTNVITGNSIHDLLTSGSQSIGIYFTGTGTTTIAGNRITALNVNAATTTVFGIYAVGSTGSTLNVVNNQITLSPAASGSKWLYGLYDTGTSGSALNAFHNSIVIGGTETGNRNSWACRRLNANTHSSRNNIFLNLRTGGSGSHYASGSESSGGNYTVSNNVYAGTGATAASFMVYITTSGTPVPVSFATWQTATGDTNSVAGIAGSGNFTAALFVNAATGDLHLVPGGNPLVNATGSPVAGVTDDFDGELRSVTTPSIGSDEFPHLDISFTDWATSAGLLAENATPTATPYHDGIENLLKYAFNMNGGGPDVSVLATGGTAGLPRITLDSSGAQRVLRVEFLRRKGSGLIYTPQRSNSLSGFVAMTGAEVVTAIDAQWERVTVEEPAPYLTSPSLFARVQVTLP